MYIFDLDNTLADCEHRRHFVDPKYNENYVFIDDTPSYYELKNSCKKFKPDWKSFYEACSEDKVIYPTMCVLSDLLRRGAKIQIWSGRCESTEEKTLKWACDNWWIGINPEDIRGYFPLVKMRPIGDYTPDDQLKERWLDEAIAEGKSIDAVFDDRKKVVEMWRRRGIFVFDVSQGKCDF